MAEKETKENKENRGKVEALRTARETIEKNFGKGAIMTLGEHTKAEVSKFSTLRVENY